MGKYVFTNFQYPQVRLKFITQTYCSPLLQALIVQKTGFGGKNNEWFKLGVAEQKPYKKMCDSPIRYAYCLITNVKKYGLNVNRSKQQHK